MIDFYFREQRLQAGESFRPVFDRNTEHLSDLLQVHAGDLMEEGWGSEPIEILFIDFAKTWNLNDFIVAEFFPCLVPGRSVVVQQDFVFAGCPWVALTMEHLSDYFEPVAFAEYCSVVYVCRKQVPRGLPPVSTIPRESRTKLMDRAIERFRGYPRLVLECAKAAMLVEGGDTNEAEAIVARVAIEDGQHFAVKPAIDLVRSLY
jgi:hypothetical protein